MQEALNCVGGGKVPRLTQHVGRDGDEEHGAGLGEAERRLTPCRKCLKRAVCRAEHVY